MKRSGPIRRTTPLRPGKPTKRKGRSAAEKARVYGPAERIEWLKGHPCLACGSSPSEVAHVRNGGVSRKGDASETVPLCNSHHRESHRIGVKSFETRHGFMLHNLTLVEWAAWFNAAWQRHSGLTPLSEIVPGVVSSLLARASKESA